MPGGAREHKSITQLQDFGFLLQVSGRLVIGWLCCIDFFDSSRLIVAWPIVPKLCLKFLPTISLTALSVFDVSQAAIKQIFSYSHSTILM